MRNLSSSVAIAIGGFAAAVLAPTTYAQLIVHDQPHDFNTFSPSEQGTAIPSARTADDFTPPFLFAGRTIVQMVASFPNMPTLFSLDWFTDDPSGGPGDLLATQNGAATDLGEWNGNPNLHLIEVSFSGFSFDSLDTVWLSPYAIGNGTMQDRGFWGTAGNMGQTINGSEGYFMSESLGVPDWTPVSDPSALGFATDFAYRIEFIPAPGAAALFALASDELRRVPWRWTPQPSPFDASRFYRLEEGKKCDFSIIGQPSR